MFKANHLKSPNLQDPSWWLMPLAIADIASCIGVISFHSQVVPSHLSSYFKQSCFASIVLYYYWRYVQETGETGTTVGSLLVLGMVIFFCAQKAVRVRFNNKELVGKCQRVRNELEETKEAYRTYKQAVENTLPELKKLLVVVDHDVSLYRSLQGLKCKDE